MPDCSFTTSDDSSLSASLAKLESSSLNRSDKVFDVPISLAERYWPSRWKDSLGIAHPTVGEELDPQDISSCRYEGKIRCLVNIT